VHGGYGLGPQIQGKEGLRECYAKRSSVLSSSVGFWEGSLGVGITQCPYLGDPGARHSTLLSSALCRGANGAL
jgi:hypothetical protein